RQFQVASSRAGACAWPQGDFNAAGVGQRYVAAWIAAAFLFLLRHNSNVAVVRRKGLARLADDGARSARPRSANLELADEDHVFRRFAKTHAAFFGWVCAFGRQSIEIFRLELPRSAVAISVDFAPAAHLVQFFGSYAKLCGSFVQCDQ